MIALVSALSLRVRVEYLDRTSAPFSSRCGPHHHVVCGPSNSLLAACLLFRPGHYDLLQPSCWDELELLSDTPHHEPDFVKPLPPLTPDHCLLCGEPTSGEELWQIPTMLRPYAHSADGSATPTTSAPATPSTPAAGSSDVSPRTECGECEDEHNGQASDR